MTLIAGKIVRKEKKIYNDTFKLKFQSSRASRAITTPTYLINTKSQSKPNRTIVRDEDEDGCLNGIKNISHANHWPLSNVPNESKPHDDVE